MMHNFKCYFGQKIMSYNTLHHFLLKCKHHYNYMFRFQHFYAIHDFISYTIICIWMIINNIPVSGYKFRMTCSIQPIQYFLKIYKNKYIFNWDSLHTRLNSHYEAWSCKKEVQKRLQDKENLFRKNLQLKHVC